MKPGKKIASSGEVIPGWNGDGVFTGREPHNSHRNQMKLFNAIAATAAVMTCCIGNPLPAEARNGWVYIGEVSTNVRLYVHDIKRTKHQGKDLVGLKQEIIDDNRNQVVTGAMAVNCTDWSQIQLMENGAETGRTSFRRILPNSVSEAVASRVC